MAQYKSKPVLVDAFRLGYEKPPEWFTDMMNQPNYESLMDSWTGGKSGKEYASYIDTEGLWIAHSRNSRTWVSRGDYICKNQYGHIYPMSKYMFERTHDAAIGG